MINNDIDWEDPMSFLTDEVIANLAQKVPQRLFGEEGIFDQV